MRKRALNRIPHPRFALFFAVLAVVSGIAATQAPPDYAMILGFDAAALAFIASALPVWLREDAHGGALPLANDDGGHLMLLATAIAAIIAILIALGSLVEGKKVLALADFMLVSATLIVAWVFSNLVYAFHYAHLYSQAAETGASPIILFPDTTFPTFSDFVYFAFVIGMTCQTSDLAVTSSKLRRVMTLQGLFAFFYNLGVLAMTINVLAGVL